jgi:dihydroneopterin triphosphate diphosphatase
MRTDQVECIVFRRNENKIQFLLLKRIKEKGGFWQPITGDVENTDKNIISAALRELEEETNIKQHDIIHTFENIYSFEMTKHYLTNKNIPTITEHVFGFEIKPRTKIIITNNTYQEHEKIKWVTFEEAIKLLKWDSNKKGFEILNKIITR